MALGRGHLSRPWIPRCGDFSSAENMGAGGGPPLHRETRRSERRLLRMAQVAGERSRMRPRRRVRSAPHPPRAGSADSASMTVIECALSKTAAYLPVKVRSW